MNSDRPPNIVTSSGLGTFAFWKRRMGQQARNTVKSSLRGVRKDVGQTMLSYAADRPKRSSSA